MKRRAASLHGVVAGKRARRSQPSSGASTGLMRTIHHYATRLSGVLRGGRLLRRSAGSAQRRRSYLPPTVYADHTPSPVRKGRTRRQTPVSPCAASVSTGTSVPPSPAPTDDDDAGSEAFVVDPDVYDADTVEVCSDDLIIDDVIHTCHDFPSDESTRLSHDSPPRVSTPKQSRPRFPGESRHQAPASCALTGRTDVQPRLSVHPMPALSVGEGENKSVDKSIDKSVDKFVSKSLGGTSDRSTGELINDVPANTRASPFWSTSLAPLRLCLSPFRVVEVANEADMVLRVFPMVRWSLFEVEVLEKGRHHAVQIVVPPLPSRPASGGTFHAHVRHIKPGYAVVNVLAADRESMRSASRPPSPHVLPPTLVAKRLPGASVRVVYKGHSMDSMLEARHAVLMDALNIQWVSQPAERAFVTRGRKYTPDFYLPGLNVVLEIKGRPPCGKELKRCKTLSTQCDDLVVLFYDGIGNPYMMENVYTSRRPPRRCSSYVYHRGELLAGRAAWGVRTLADGRKEAFLFVGDLAGTHYELCGETLTDAYALARSARFERV